MDDAALTTRVCELLGGIDGWEWRDAGGKYSASVVGVFYGAIDDSPDRAVGVRVYGGEDPRDLTTRRVQLRIRGERGRRDGADTLAGAALTLLHGIDRWMGISQIRRFSFAPLGADGNGREERSENYQVILDNTETTS